MIGSVISCIQVRLYIVSLYSLILVLDDAIQHCISLSIFIYFFLSLVKYDSLTFLEMSIIDGISSNLVYLGSKYISDRLLISIQVYCLYTSSATDTSIVVILLPSSSIESTSVLLNFLISLYFCTTFANHNQYLIPALAHNLKLSIISWFLYISSSLSSDACVNSSISMVSLLI